MAAPTTSVAPTQSALSSGQGSLSSLESNTYDYTTSRYPLDGLGTQTIPHYVTFNINLPTNSKYIANAGGAVNVTTASQNNYNINQSTGGISQVGSGQVQSAAGAGAVVGAIQGAASGTGGILGGAAVGGLKGGVTTGAGVVVAQGINLQPKYNRVKKAIAIYMPDTVMTSYSHDYSTVSLTDALGLAGQAAAIGAAGIGGMAATALLQAGGDIAAITGIDKFKTGNGVKYNDAQGAEAAGILGNALGTLGPGFTDLALKGVNAAINPQAELVFKGTGNRSYQFIFDFQPRSSLESTAILDIIQTFRMYAAPEATLDGNGRYFIPPAQFDIKFYFMNTENLAIARISTCVLTDIQVNYAQSGAWATFNDGMPVHINMVLSFKEIDIITRQLISSFGY